MAETQNTPSGSAGGGGSLPIPERGGSGASVVPFLFKSDRAGPEKLLFIGGGQARKIAQENQMTDPTREEIDAKLEANISKVETIETRIGATLKEFSSGNEIFKKDVTNRLDIMATEIKHLPSTWTLISAIGASSVAVITIVLGVIAFGGDRFDGGVQITSVSTQQAIEAQHLSRENSEQIKALAARSEKNDAQIEAIYKALVGNGGRKIPGGQNE